MTDFPTVGLGVDLTGIDQGEKAYDRLQKKIQGVGDAADAMAGKVQNSARRAKAATGEAASADTQRSRAAQKAAADEARAEAQANREKERQRRYLQQVRIRSIQMEEAARRAAQMDEARAVAQRVREAERAAREMERLAASVARGQTRWAQQATRAEQQAQRQRVAEAQRAEREMTRAAAAEAKKRAAADRQAAAEAERNRRYLLQVRINSLRMEEQAERAAARERERLVQQASRAELQETRRLAAERAAYERSLRRGGAGGGGGGGGGGTPPAAGGGASGPGGLVTRGDLALIEMFRGSLTRLRTSLTDARRLFFDVRTAVGVFLAGMVVRPVLDMADAMTALRARAGAFTDQASDVPYLMEAIYKAAQRSRTPLESIATLYTRLAPLAKQLGKSQMDLLRISETVAKGFQIGGATAEEAKSSAQQLAQALASNRLGGDELRSLAENAPILVQQIAKALDMNTGQFIKWAHAGKANAAVVIGALEEASTEIDRLFGKFPVTVSQAVTLVGNSLQYLVGRVDEMTGASRGIAGFIAQFAALLESQQTINAVAKAVELLGQSLHFLGQAFQVVAAAWPVLAAVLAGMAVGRLMAIVKGWQALQKALLAYAAATAIAGRATATFMVAQTAASAAVSGAKAAIGSLVAMLGGPLGIALIAAAGAYAYYRANVMDAQEATKRFEDANATAAAGIQRAIAFMEVYGGDTRQMTDYLLQLNGVQDEQVKGLDEAGRAAVARAANERTLAAALMERAAAESTSAAAAMRRSVVFDRIAAGYYDFEAKMTPTYGGNAQQVAKRNESIRRRDEATNRGNFKESLATRLEAQAERLPQMAAALLKSPLNVTQPTGAGKPTATTTPGKPGRSPWEGAMDQIAKMKAEVEGLQQAIDNLSANPLAALNEQIIAAGNEAAARMEGGNKQNEALAAEARQVAMQKERLTILKQLMEESARNEQQLGQESDSYKVLADAQERSTTIMRDFWGAGGGSLEQYMDALQRSRDEMMNAEIAEKQLEISRRFGVDSLDQIAEALVKYTGATEQNAQKLQDQAMAEAEAAEAAIRRKAALDAIASADQDFAGYNEKTFEGLERALDHMTLLADGLGEALVGAFGSGGRAAQQMLRVLTNQRNSELEGRRRVAEMEAKYGKDSVEATKEQQRVSAELEQQRLAGYATMVGAAKTFFKENSAGYKALTIAEIALNTLTTLNTLKAMALDGVYTATSVANSGTRATADGVAAYAKTLASLPFPFNLAAGATVLAALAAVGVAIAGGRGGGGTKTPLHEQRQTAQGAGTVLGDAAAKSESIVRSLEIVAANSNEDLEYTNDMLVALRSIDSGISALTASLARQLGVGGFLNPDVAGLGTSRSGPSTLATLAVGGPVGLLLSKLPVIGGIINSLFGKKTTTTLADAGLQFGGGSLGSILSGGISAQTYQDLAIQTKKKAFGITYSNKTRYETRTGAVDDAILEEINRVIGSLRDGVLSAAGLLGVQGAQAALDAMQVNLGKISFKDMTGEEIEQALQSIFSALGDQMAATAVPALEELQKAGEGAFETLIRVARNYQVLDLSLKSIGMTFGAVGVASLKAREDLIEMAGGIDELVSQINKFSEDYLTESERMLPIITSVFTELGKMGYDTIRTKDQFKELVLAQDLTTESGRQTYASLLKLAPAFSKVVDYMDGLKTTTEEVADATQDLMEAYEREADRLQELIDNQTEAGANLIAVYQEQANAILDTQHRFEDFMATLKEFRQSLEVGELAANSPVDQYTKTKAAYEEAVAAARGGDENAIRNLPALGEAFLRASQDYFAGTEPYFRDLEQVKQTTDDVMGVVQAQIDTSKAQLQALNDLIDGIDGVLNGIVTLGETTYEIREGIFQVREAANMTLNQALSEYAQAMVAAEGAKEQLKAVQDQITELQKLNGTALSIETALQNLATAQQNAAEALNNAINAMNSAIEAGRNTPPPPPANTNTPPPANNNTPWNAEGYLARNPDILAAYNDLISRADRNSPWWDQHGLDSPEQFATWHYYNQGITEDRQWAEGGAFARGGQVVNVPTMFDPNILAEEQSEAVVPLARTSDGDLGVRMVGGNDSKRDDSALIAALGTVAYELRLNRVVDQEGYRQMVEGLGELRDETADQTAQSRRNAA